MKQLSRAIVAILMVILMAALLPMQVMADSQTEYISEIKVGYGVKDSDAKAGLDGYTILSDEQGNPIDLNQKAGGGAGSRGDRVVYLGYKTTTERNEAVTDLAVMNMKGGYSVADYEAMMETQMKAQIIPFVDTFLAAIKEYRENYASDNEENQARAQYVHDVLNNFLDDDCGGAGLGDLLLNETKYEMGDEAYDALSDAEKNEHADILTIIAQSNGKATMMMENLLVRGADTNDDTWVDRFTSITYDDLLDETELAPSQAKKEVARLYDDDANDLLALWDAFRAELLDNDSFQKTVDEYDGEKELEEAEQAAKKAEDSKSVEQQAEALTEVIEADSNLKEYQYALQQVLAHDYLESIEYGDGTLLDFFTKESTEIEEDITVLYPLIASLSDGQRAGLGLVNMRQLIGIAMCESDGYKDASTDNFDPLSVYDGVDRGIYEKGGVALTSDALRTKALENTGIEDDSMLSPWTIASWAIAGTCAGIAIGTGVLKKIVDHIFDNGRLLQSQTTDLSDNFKAMLQNFSFTDPENEAFKAAEKGFNESGRAFAKVTDPVNYQKGLNQAKSVEGTHKFLYHYGNKIALGLTVASVIIAGVSLYLTYQDMRAYYEVDFTPIPHYIVDEKDLVAYNAKGEKVILKNQSAYYKAVETNRPENDENYSVLGVSNDMNGDVGKQWLTLYAVKNEAEDPILASSLKAVVDDTNLPAGYETGIHMFGSEAAFNLNNTQYVWNASAPATFVYFQRDAGKAAKNTGANFTTGSLAIAGGAGLALGAVVTALGMKASKKRKNQEATA